ncbi:hypothetical protein HPB47_020508 [Ixodes persulcatus]|uniref:Uncharacterized protein n=1 Tax=Ixodes persulcatus TaxID=34615 RepID=A0AC60QII0_IXOPE|nr:hypothetical protein HPB47_020508 [Ixodes persulcatus]
MDIDRVNSHEWQTVGTAPRQPHTTTIIVKLSDDINLGSVDTHMLGADVLHAAGLNTIERKDTHIKVRTIQNLLAIDTYRPSAETKLLALKTVHIQGKQHEIRRYKANDPANARGVVHGIPATLSEEEIRNTLEVEHAKLLHLRRIGTSNTILVTVKGPTATALRLYEPRRHKTAPLPAAKHPLHDLLCDRTPRRRLPKQNSIHHMPQLQQTVPRGSNSCNSS